MPAARATSSTLTSSKPRLANSSSATLVMWSPVVDLRLPTRAAGSRLIEIAPSVSALDAIFLRSRSHLSRPTKRKGATMEPTQQAETETELVTESLVEEVSIDGMCGVY